MPSSLFGYIKCIDDVADERDTVLSPPFHLSPSASFIVRGELPAVLLMLLMMSLLEIHVLDIGTQMYMCCPVKVCQTWICNLV